MATGLGSAGANTGGDAINAAYTWVQLHVGSPGANGTSNVATETARKQVTWVAYASGATSNSNILTWPSVAGSEDYTHFTVWTANAAGTFGWSGLVTASAVTAGDTFQVAAGDLDASFTLAS